MTVPDLADLKARAVTRWRGHRFEEFEPGQVFEHHWGRTITEADNTFFTTLTLSYNPLYFNAEYARAHGHAGTVVNPMLVFLVVFGMSVEDLSEGGPPKGAGAPGEGQLAGGFLGVDKLRFHRSVYVGETLTASSEVVAARRSSSRPGSGIVTWFTQGRNQDRATISFERSNMMPT